MYAVILVLINAIVSPAMRLPGAVCYGRHWTCSVLALPVSVQLQGALNSEWALIKL